MKIPDSRCRHLFSLLSCSFKIFIILNYRFYAGLFFFLQCNAYWFLLEWFLIFILYFSLLFPFLMDEERKKTRKRWKWNFLVTLMSRRGSTIYGSNMALKLDWNGLEIGLKWPWTLRCTFNKRKHESKGLVTTHASLVVILMDVIT